MRHILNNIELWLSGAGLVLIVLVPALLGTRDSATWWYVAAITATCVGVLHGCIFWVVRRRQRMLRQSALREVQGMLKDRINNRLTSMLLHLSMVESHAVANDLGAIQESIETISKVLDRVSEESLHEWRTQYQGALK